MTLINRIAVRTALFLMFASAGIAAANGQTIEETSNGEFHYLRSDLVVRTSEWSMIRLRVLQAYGLESVEEIPFEEVGPLGSQPNPLFTAEGDTLSILHLMLPPIDTQILYELAALYSDITPDEIASFQDGVVIETTNFGGGPEVITVHFFANGPISPIEAPSSGSSGPEATTAALISVLPEERDEMAFQSDPSGGGYFSFDVLGDRLELLTLFVEVLGALGFSTEVIERGEDFFLRASNSSQIVVVQFSAGFTDGYENVFITITVTQ